MHNLILFMLQSYVRRLTLQVYFPSVLKLSCFRHTMKFFLFEQSFQLFTLCSVASKKKKKIPNV